MLASKNRRKDDQMVFQTLFHQDNLWLLYFDQFHTSSLIHFDILQIIKYECSGVAYKGLW